MKINIRFILLQMELYHQIQLTFYLKIFPLKNLF